MARDIFINGETLVLVKGRADSAIGAVSELGLAVDSIRIRQNFVYLPVQANAWGGSIPFEEQIMLQNCVISMTLVHFDPDVLDVCLNESLGGAASPGQVRRAGARMGNNLARFAGGGQTGNHYISLNLSSPVAGKPYRFYTSHLEGPPIEMPLGTERSLVVLNWLAIPYTTDPYGGGSGANNAVVYDHVLDN
jgi:hypothetical protein